MAQKINSESAIMVMINAGLEPIVPFVNTSTKWKCRCQVCQREVFPIYSKVKSGHKGCPYCSGNKVDLKEIEKILKQRRLKPLTDYPGASTTWKMLCLKCEEIFNSRLDYIKFGRGCPFCSKARILEKDAILIMNKVGLQPLEPFKSIQARWKNNCLKCGKVSFRTLHNVKVTGKGCPHCSFAKTRTSQDKMIKIAKDLGYEPMEPYELQTKLWKLKCLKCGKETKRYPSSLNYRRRSSSTGLTGCLGCAIRQKVKGSNQAKLAINLMEKSGFEILEPYISAKHPWRVRCKKCKMEMTKQYTHVKSENKGCKYCSGNYLNNEQILLIMHNAFLEPLEPYKNSQTPWKSKCLKCNKVVRPRFGGISAGIGGCKFCGAHGLDLNSPAFIYLITSDELRSHKVGVSGLDIPTDRLLAHRKNGWSLYKKMNVETGEIAYIIEQKVLSWIREDLKLQSYIPQSLMPQGGYTETFSSEEVDLPIVWSQLVSYSKQIKPIDC